MNATAHVPYPQLTMDDATPRSAAFGDVYFSRQGGVAETTHVFLAGNHLPARWQASPSPAEPFTIAELGFGTGLNFLVTWQAWQASTAPRPLHYIALEQYPLTPEMLHPVLALQPELASLAAALLAQYPARLPGWHRLRWGRVTLTLGFGAASALMQELTGTVDAWYLDGFSPAKNPDMWGADLFAAMARHSKPGTRFATFTAASAVRNGLQAEGFTVQKIPGFGHKRDMLVGVFAAETSAQHGAAASEYATDGGITPQRPPLHDSAAPTRHTTQAADAMLVIGGGIAGCSIAHALAMRGRAVTLVSAGIADGASGNEAAVLFPQLSKRWLPSTAWFFAGMDYAQRQLHQLQATSSMPLFAEPGLLRLPRHAQEEAALRRLNEALGVDCAVARWVEQDEASRLAGLPLLTGAAYLPRGAWAHPARWCAALVQHPNITVQRDTTIAQLTREGSDWLAISQRGETLRARTVCVANAQQANRLLPVPLKLGVTAGQVSMLPRAAWRAVPQAVLCHKGYVIAHEAQVLIGATYDRADVSGAVTAENHLRNLAEIEHFLPGLVTGTPLAGRTSFRATTPDRLPYVGLVEEGLWVSVGHGSRGMVSAPLAGEVIASAICGEQVPLAPLLRRALDPRRGFQ